MRVLTSTAFLFPLWLLLSGHYTALLLIFGIISCAATAILVARLGVSDLAARSFRFSLRVLLYLPWLIWEIIKSNLQVAALIWKPSAIVDPRIVLVRASQRTDMGIALHANSITLTPGTLSLDTNPGEIEVHALTSGIAASLYGGQMNSRVCRVEGTS